ncbi:2139_t:CDS:2, partial [Entrophospora sp. SA101]
MSIEFNSSFIETGSIVSTLHYGPFAKFWWESKLDPNTNIKKFYPIRLHLKMLHCSKDLSFCTLVNQGKNNKPEYSCYWGEINETGNEMSTVVNNPYKKYLEHTHSFVYRKLNGSDFFGMGNELQLKKISADITFFPFIINECKFKMFVVDASYDKSEPSDGYHITFIERSKREYVLFSQTYNKNKFFLNIYSLNSGKILQAFQNLDQIIDNLINFQTNCHEWNQNIFDKLHIAYMIHINNKDLTTSVLKYLHDKKSTLFEFYNLLYKFKIIEKNSEKDGTVIRKIRAWRQLLNASGCKQIKIYKNNEYWTKAEDTAADLETLDLFTETDLNLQPELDSDLDVKIFWKCFEDAMSSNIK